jgi:hypothetical protein
MFFSLRPNNNFLDDCHVFRPVSRCAWLTLMSPYSAIKFTTFSSSGLNVAEIAAPRSALASLSTQTLRCFMSFRNVTRTDPELISFCSNSGFGRFDAIIESLMRRVPSFAHLTKSDSGTSYVHQPSSRSEVTAETASSKETCGAGISQDESGRLFVGRLTRCAAANSVSSASRSWTEALARVARRGSCDL